MNSLDRRSIPYCFDYCLFRAALRPHRVLLMAVVLLSDLAWGGTVPLAQTIAFDEQQTTAPAGLLNQTYRVAMEDARNVYIADAPGNRFDSTDGALPVTKVMLTSGWIVREGATLSATQSHATSTLPGSPTLGMILGGGAQPQLKAEPLDKGLPTAHYWTLRRKIETAGVTLLHMADAAQTCWHEANTPHWHEQNPMTPNTCQGAAVALIGSGPILQWASYRLTQRYPHSRFWAHVDHILPQIEISVSAMSIRCSHTGSCNQYGF